jgi:hypothetical protein
MSTKVLASKIDGLQFPFLAMGKECQQQCCQKDVPLPTVFVRNIEKMRGQKAAKNPLSATSGDIPATTLFFYERAK